MVTEASPIPKVQKVTFTVTNPLYAQIAQK